MFVRKTPHPPGKVWPAPHGDPGEKWARATDEGAVGAGLQQAVLDLLKAVSGGPAT